MVRITLSLFLIFIALSFTQAQKYFPDHTGILSTEKGPIALTNARLHISPGVMIENGTIILREQRISKLGSEISIPEGVRVVDLKGKHIYPSFIDVYTEFGYQKPERPKSNGQPQYGPLREGYYWNDHIRPDQNAPDAFEYDAKKAQAFRKAGFGAVQTHFADGIIRGTGMVLCLRDEKDQILKDRSAQFLSFDRSRQTRQAYPNSIMGKTALIRQVQHDLNAYNQGLIERKDLALEAFEQNLELPQIFEAGSYLNGLRVNELSKATEQSYIILGGGDEYKRIQEIKNCNASWILPLNFPDAYDVEDPYMASQLSLGDMKHWQRAPSNPYIFEQEDIPFCLTTYELKKPGAFMKQLRKALKRGLSEEAALAALTTRPAKWLGLENDIGRLQEEGLANFIITNGGIFDDSTHIYQHWILGEAEIYKELDEKVISGQYEWSWEDQKAKLTIKEQSGKYRVKAQTDSLKRSAQLTVEGDWVYLLLSAETKGEFIRFSARIHPASDTLRGQAVLPSGSPVEFIAYPLPETEEMDEEEEESESGEDATEEKNKMPPDSLLPIRYPNIAFGVGQPNPGTGSLLIKNATVITGEEEGTLEDTDVLVTNGKIAKIGRDIELADIEVIDANGHYLTAGIVDEHSHIAGTSINESGQNSSAEVRMKDAVNPDDISIYRALAGGVTSIQLLHGSANPIGGQSAILKLKWGGSAEDLLYDPMPPFIKFALGENVKQSNWGGNSRFPQSRMGVEQVYRDYFSRALEYQRKKQSGAPYRVDEELETLLQIVRGNRFISCHAYIQSEINMLMKVAEDFGFTVNTFTHILEGYKVADKMAEHGAGGSSFSDWWAYKYEVKDAIPHNAAIMNEQGVTTAINSDDAEMMRRLNQEAAKSIKYGNMSREDAWKMVTLNPAKLLHIDDRVGSIKTGKDADLVIWDHHPLSIYAVPQTTIIEGVVYFDIERDRTLQQRVQEERAFLINQMLQAKNKGMKTQPVKKKEKKHYCCDTIDQHE